METWKPIKGYEGLYEVSDVGRIRSVDRIVCHGKNHPDHTRILKGRIINQQLNPGHRSNILARYSVGLSKDGKVSQKQVHRLVAEAFLVDFNSELEVNHIDGDPLNNCVENLEMVTRIENIKHAFENGLIGTSMKVCKLDADTLEILEVYISESKACRENDTYQGRVKNAIDTGRILNGYRWSYA